MPLEINEKDLRHIFAYVDKAADAINEQDHSINFVVSTDKLDRHGEIVLPEAVAEAAQRKGEFADNPVALACHLHRLADGMPPAVGSWDVTTLKTKAHRVEMRLRFAVDTKLGDEYWKLYSKRHMRAVSIGFRIFDGHEEVKDDKRYYIITKIELYEISCVAVGANPQALSKLKEFFSQDISPVTSTLEVAKDRWEEVFKGTVPSSVKQYFDEHFKNIKTIIEEQEEKFDEIISLLIADKGEMAEQLLGGKSGSESSVTGSDQQQAARFITVLQKVINEMNN